MSAKMLNGSTTQETCANENPIRRANIFSLTFYLYTIPLFKTGWKREINENDLYKNLPEHSSEKLGEMLRIQWEKELKKEKPSLLKALLRTFGGAYFKYCLISLTLQSLRIIQPVALFYLMKFYMPNQTDYTLTDAYIFTTIIILCSSIYVVVAHSYILALSILGMKLRVACSSLIYRKCLRLSNEAMANTSVGQMINLLANDVNRFDTVCYQLPYMLILPFEMIVIMYLIYHFVGFTPYVGLAAILALIPLQVYLGKKFSVIRLKTAKKTDERVRLMSEIISGIQVIKMYSWEESFAKLVSIARKLEIRQIGATCRIRALTLSFQIFISRIAIFVSILVYVLLGHVPSPEFVFMVIAFYGIVRQSMTISVPSLISQIAETRISINRLQTFLEYKEIEAEKVNECDLIDVGIKLEEASGSWNGNFGLQNISLTLGNGDILGVIGDVGSGKSSLLQMILKELPCTGKICVNGKISYAAQEPWLFTGSIKQNILFQNHYNKLRYDRVVEICALNRDFSLFPHGDETIIGEKGIILSGGQRSRINLARAIYEEADIYLLDDPLSAVDTHVGKHIYEKCIQDFLKDKTRILITHQIQYLKSIDNLMMLKNGKVTFQGTYRDLQNVVSDEFSALLKKYKSDEGEDGDGNKKDFDGSLEKKEVQESLKETRAKGKVNKGVYLDYLKAGGNLCKVAWVAILFVLTQGFGSASDYFVTYWVNIEQSRNDTAESSLSTEQCICIYSAIIIATIVMTLTRSMTFFGFCMKSSTKLHNNMFGKIVKAPMKFFNLNSAGIILNRFSKDIGTIDEQFPYVSLDTMQISLVVLGVTVVSTVVNPPLLGAVCLILIIFYFLRVVYLRSSRNVKRLEGITKSPVFTHISSSIQGLTTIRAFGAQEMLIKKFDLYQDTHSSSFYLFLTCSRAFGFWLDFICSFYVAFVGYSFLITQETFGGNVGLAITQSLTLTGMFQWGMRQWSEMENQMTSVERVLEYTNVKQERNIQEIPPPENWPDKGSIQFNSVYLKYSEKENYVLKNVNFYVKPKEKIGIVGRTGAGKSSLITALFQLAQTEGEILIDNVNTQTIPLSNLRSKLSIIPQEPVLFAGTLRRNLDPFEEFTDEALWNSLEQVELKGLVAELPLCLNTVIQEGGSNFSVGQRQLLCLARAIIRDNKILVLDEATANVDPRTDELIQKTIRVKFRECTVLTIAHRLNTIVDSDKVLVMDEGEVKEFGQPFKLLMDKSGYFYSMVQKTGPIANTLIASAKEHYVEEED